MPHHHTLERLIGAVSILATSPEPLAGRLRAAWRGHLARIDPRDLPGPMATQLEFVIAEIRARQEETGGERMDDQTASALAERVLILCVEALRSA